MLPQLTLKTESISSSRNRVHTQQIARNCSYMCHKQRCRLTYPEAKWNTQTYKWKCCCCCLPCNRPCSREVIIQYGISVLSRNSVCFWSMYLCTHTVYPRYTMWNLWWAKWHLGSFSLSTLVFLAKLHSTNCSTVTIICHLGLVQ
jgi:hypothetical protein